MGIAIVDQNPIAKVGAVEVREWKSLDTGFKQYEIDAGSETARVPQITGNFVDNITPQASLGLDAIFVTTALVAAGIVFKNLFSSSKQADQKNLA